MTTQHFSLILSSCCRYLHWRHISFSIPTRNQQFINIGLSIPRSLTIQASLLTHFLFWKILNRPGNQYLRSANSTSKGGQSHSEKKSMGRKAAPFHFDRRNSRAADTKAVYRFDWYNHKHGTHLGDSRTRSHCKPPSKKKERKKK